MKTFRNLFPQIISFENVYAAYRKARKGKRYKEYTLSFSDDIESELFSIIDDLKTGTYAPGAYHTFMVYEPKERMICAAPFRDRVVHHAICNVVEPLFDRTFIDDSYACRKGKGTHRALFRSWEFMRERRYVLKCDIRKYFTSIDHEVLKRILQRKIACDDTLRLIDTIIDHGNEVSPVHGKGLPIGNLTSQFFANIYLNELDMFAKHELKAKRYVRYMDDFIIFHDDKLFLHQCKHRIRSFLSNLKLELKPGKSEIIPIQNGFEFLGFFNKPDKIRVKKESVKRFTRRLRELRWKYGNGETSISKIGESVRSWCAHATYADSVHLKRDILRGFTV